MDRFLEKSCRFKPVTDTQIIVNTPSVDVIDPNQQLLDLIFGIDEVTGMPIGDLSYYKSEKTNPEVKRFIELNLFTENSGDSGMSFPTDVMNKIRDTITDDDIARFSRCKGESKEDYACRINDFFNQERQKRAEENRHRAFRKRVDNVIKKYATGD